RLADRRRRHRPAVRAQCRRRHHPGAGHPRRQAGGAVRSPPAPGRRPAGVQHVSLLPARQGLRLGWRLLRRDLAAGQVRVLLAALALTVAAVTTVGFVTDRAQRALAAEANRLLGADAVLRGDAPIGEEPRALARELGPATTEPVSLRAMPPVGGRLQPGQLAAPGAGGPLRR